VEKLQRDRQAIGCTSITAHSPAKGSAGRPALRSVLTLLGRAFSFDFYLEAHFRGRYCDDSAASGIFQRLL